MAASRGRPDLLTARAMDLDQPVPYLRRTHAWYAALGYDTPYRYAQFEDVPFQLLAKPLRDCVVALVTTAAPFQPDKGPQGPGAPYNAAAKFFQPYTGDTSLDHDLRISHVAIDRKHTSMEDSNSWFPLPVMRRWARQGRFGLAPRFHGVPTNRSQRHTLEVDVPLLVQRCREDGIDAAVLVPNCPVCHQTLSLAARALEAAGIATVVMGCARDIVEHVGVPRLLFSDFPLGNAAGKPHDAASQEATLEMALDLLQAATGPRTTVQSPQRWSTSADWKLDYCNPERAAPGELARLRAEFEAGKETARALRGSC
jgi:D-proline reductase (dithiol) PrdB